MNGSPGAHGATLPSLRARWLRWPLPALLAWALGWSVYGLLEGGPWPAWAEFGAATMAPLILLPRVGGGTRRSIVAAGFPLSALALGAAGHLPAWAWLLPLAGLLLLYPLRAWRDAPLYPTAPDALEGLRDRLALPPAPRLLDAGCGLGHGLAALRHEWPQARLAGVERSAPLAWMARRRVHPADVVWGDMWQCSWSGNDLVYLFQRPESMARAWAKAQAELPPGSWLVSLEFAVPGREPEVAIHAPGRRPLWAYRVRGEGAEAPCRPAQCPFPAQPRRQRADKRR